MSNDYRSEFQILRDLYERVQRKEDVEAEDFTKAGVKLNARLKDIEKALSAMKKKVSLMRKQEEAEEEEKELADLAMENNVTVEEMREILSGKNEKTLDPSCDFGARHTAQEKKIAQDRDKKRLAAETHSGDFDLYSEYV